MSAPVLAEKASEPCCSRDDLGPSRLGGSRWMTHAAAVNPSFRTSPRLILGPSGYRVRNRLGDRAD